MAVEKLLLAKIEVTYDTDPTPDDTNAIETMDLETARYEGDRTAREVDRQTLGGYEQININPHAGFTFGVPLASSGAAGTAPAHGILWQACGFDEVVDVGVDVQYQLAANQADLLAADSVTMWDYRAQANMAQKATGCRGKTMITMASGELPKIEFSDFLGTYNRPAALATPTVASWAGWMTELPFTKDNVPTLTLDTVSACTESFSIDFGQQVARRNLPGCQQSVITGYEVTGSMTIVAPDISVKNWFEKAESHSVVNKLPFSLVYGTVAGGIVEISASEVQISNITEGESNEGDLAYTFDLSFLDAPLVTFK